MNLSELYNEMKNQVSRLTGVKFDESKTEAEVLADVQALPSLVEQNETFETRLSALETSIGAKFSEMTDMIGQAASKFDEVKSGVTPEEMKEAISTAIKNSIEPIQKEFAGEIKSLQELAEGYKKPAGSQEDATIESTEKEEKIQKKSTPFSIGGKNYSAK